MSDSSSHGQEKLVSVICRSIGRPQLGQALKSVADQTYRNIEIVLVEASAEPLSSFQSFAGSTTLKIISTGTRLSRSNAANAGLEASQGDFIMFLDDDDWIAEGHIQQLVSALDDNPSFSAAYSNTQKVSVDGEPTEETFDHSFSAQLLMSDNYIPIHSMLFSSALLDHGCRFDNSFEIFEDWDFWLQLSQHTAFLHVPHLSAFYRDGGESETASANDSDRYHSDNPRGQGRARLFQKWLRLWSGDELNQLLGYLDQTSTIVELNEKVISASTRAHESNLALEKLNRHIQDLETKLHESHIEASRLESAGLRAQRDAEEKTQQLDSLNRHAQALETALRSILESTSWKLMGPYRRIGRITKRLIGKSSPAPISIAEPTDRKTEASDGSDAAKEKSESLSQPFRYAIDRAVTFNGCLFIRGWAIKSPAIQSITLFINNKKIIADFGAHREDIAQAFPLVKDAAKSGFSIFSQLDQVGGAFIEFADSQGQTIRQKVKLKTLDDPSSLVSSGDFVGLDLTSQYEVYKALQAIDDPIVNFDVLKLDYTPLISIIIPVYNVESKWLDACIESVLGQSYSNWQLCLHDDASTSQETISCLKKWAEADSRIKVQFGSKNQHISGASNSALEISSGEFIGLMDNDDELHQDALWFIVEALNKDQAIDYIYTDEDKIDENGRYCQPHFKPDWSPELLESMMYVGHFGVIRRSVIDAVGGFRAGVEGSQDFDLTLRISQITQKFTHIPRVLYHWRIIPGSVSGGGDAKNYAYSAAVKALSDYTDAESQNATVVTTEYPGLYRIQRESGNPSVTIIMPFHNKAEMTISCLQSIEKSSYKNFNILLISNNSDHTSFEQVEQYASSQSHIDIQRLDIPFNWSKINNWAIDRCSSEYILLMNNDMTIISENWIESLLDCGIKQGVGAVGAKLLYEDDTIQHAGIVMQLGGIAGHAFKHIDARSPGYFGYASVVRNCSAVTGACMLVRRSVALEIGGFNEELGVAYNDVDFCLRLREANYRIIYTPFAELYHLESKTRPKNLDDMSSEQRAEYDAESAYIRKRHSTYFEAGDPYYNRALTLRLEDYSLRV